MSRPSRPRRRRTAPAARAFRGRPLLEVLEDRTLLSGDPYLPPSVMLTNPTGLLSGPAPGQPLDVARQFLVAHAADFGLRPSDLNDPVVTAQYADADTGLTHVYLRQRVNGLEVQYADMDVTLTAQNEVVAAGGGFVPGLADQGQLPVTPPLSATDAVQVAAAGLGLTPEGQPQVISQWGDPAETTLVAAPGVSLDDVTARLHYVPTEEGSAVLTWELILRTPDGDHWYDLSVGDTVSGIVTQNDWVDHSVYNVLPPPTESPQDGGFQLISSPEDPTASPFGWHDTNGVAGPEFTDTRGNNVDAHLDRNNNNVPDADELGGVPRPNGGPNLDFSGFTQDPTQQPTVQQNQNVAQVNLFYINNLLHDVHYKYGFTEAAGDFQVNNYGRGGIGNDAVQADAQDGGGTNNANFATPPDGQAPRMQMFLWNFTSPQRDGDLDNDVIIHEYGHGVSNRLTGGPANSNALVAVQSGGMGEGWSDFYSLMFQQRSTDQQNDGFGVGTYVLGQPQSGQGIRRQKYSFNMTVDPITFGAYNSDSSHEVHNTGEIWASALWDMNWQLVNKYGFDPNLATGWTAAAGPGHAGNKLTLRLVMDAMKLQPANPSFTQARDAVIAADNALNGGADLVEIWTAFARRGLGANAFTSSSSSTSVTLDFNVPAGLPYNVTSTTPAGGSVVVGPTPTQYVVNLPSPVNPATVQGSDLRVNGLPATSAALSNANQTITFTYASDPVTTQGVQSIHIDTGAFNRASDGGGVSELNATFRYDAVLLQVVSTNPPGGGVVPLGGTFNYDVTFNEPVDPASVQASDLVVSGVPGATVSGVTVFGGATTVRFTISGVSGEGTLSTSIAAGAINDAFGNPGAAFSSSFGVDVTVAAYPTPLVSLAPPGSLIYDPPVSGSIGFAGDTDSYTFFGLDAPQTVTVVVTPTSAGLTPTVSLTGPNNTVLGSAVAAGPGQKAVLQTVPINVALAGLYTITLGGLGNTTGGYTAQLILNAAAEQETDTAGTNNSRATAQDINGSFLSMPTLGGAAQRGAVVGQVSNPASTAVNLITNGGFETGDFSGWTVSLVGQNGWRINNGQIDPISPATPEPPITGSFDAFTDPTGPGTRNITQTFTVPASVSQATLSWSDRIQNFGSSFASNQEFRVQVLDANNNLLQTVFNTKPGDPLIQIGPNSRSFDVTSLLQAHAGQALKLRFEEQDSQFYFNATVDNVSLSVTAGPAAPGSLVSNGGFETGDFSGWTVLTSDPGLGTWQINNGTLDPASPATPQPPISGSFDALSNTTGPGTRSITQTFTVPTTVLQATLSWSDRIQNFANAFVATTQEFRVEILDASNNVLQTIFATKPGDPLIQLGPNARSFDLTSLLQAHAGQALKLRFEEQDNLFYLNVTVDNVSLVVNAGSSSPDSDFYSVNLTAGQPVNLALALPGFTPGPVSFSGTRTDFTTPGLPGQTGTIPLDVTYRDLNGDGKLDMISANGGATGGPNSAGSVAVRLGNGDGTFGAPTVYATNGVFTRFLDLGDVNGDGKLDVVASNTDSNTVALLLGNGDGTFNPATTYAVHSAPLGLTVRDLNGDGLADVVVPHFNSNDVAVLLGRADGTLAPAKFFTVAAGGPFTTAVGDVNGDGKLDVATGDFLSGAVSVLLGDGAGNFNVFTVLGNQGSGTWGVALADLNGDGKLDVITGNQNSNNLGVRLGNGNGTFGGPTFFSTGGSGPRTVALGDVNGDGKLDVVVPNINSTNVGVLLGNGNGTFGTVLTFSTNTNPNFATLADVNGDGVDDLSTADAGTNGLGSVSLRLNTSPTVSLQLQGAAGNLVAFGSPGASNFGRALHYVPSVSGTYYVRVSGAAANYDLVVMRNAAFEAEANDALGSAADITGTRGVLGAVAATTDVDWYKVTLAPNQTSLQLATRTPSDGPFEFANTLDPQLQLFTASGQFVAGGSQLIDGRNETLQAFGLTPGATYFVRVAGQNGTKGEYFLAVNAPPVAADDSATTNEDTPVTINLLANDSDDVAVVAGTEVVNAPAHGTVQTFGSGVVLYTPDPNYSGTDTFRYTVKDQGGAISNSAVVTVTVVAVADTPTLTVTPTAAGDENAPVPLDVQAALTDTDGSEVLSVTVGGVPASAVLSAGTNNGDGTWSLAPDQLAGLTLTMPDNLPGDAPFTLTVTATSTEQSNGSTASISRTIDVTVRNVAPTVTGVTGVASVNEGDTYTVSGTFHDPGILDTHTVVIGWGSGEGSTTLTTAGPNPDGTTLTSLGNGDRAFSASHLYADDNPSGTPSDLYAVSVTVTDKDGGTGGGGTGVTVNNVAPTVTALTPAGSVDENGTFTVAGTFFDPGVLDTHTVVVTWGGGTPDQPAEGSTTLNEGDLTYLGGGVWSFTASHQYLDDNPTGTPSDLYGISVTVTDDDTGVGTAATAVTVNNVSPVVTSLTPPSAVNENGVYTLTGTFHDDGTLDSHTVVIGWGGGAPGQPAEGSTALTDADLTYLGGGDWQFTATHRYLDDNPTGTPSDLYAVSVTVTDDDAGVGSGGTAVTVNNVAPVITALAGPDFNPAVRWEALAFGGSFTDVGTLDTHTASFDWGDGTSSPAALTEAQGAGSVSASHAYTASGTYTVTLTVQDDDGGTVAVTRQVTVVPAAVQDDPLRPGQMMLVGGGTTGDDRIGVQRQSQVGYVVVIETRGTPVSEWDGAFAVPVGRVVVYGGDGNDEIDVNDNVTAEAWLFGGAGDDHLEGGGGNNVLVGGDGNDSLTGGRGRDLLIGGAGSDDILGKGGDDILVGGTTAWDVNQAALNALLQEWTRADADYATRVAHLRGDLAGGLNGTYLLNSTTVFDDGAADALTGGSGTDWFWAGLGDVIRGRKAGEVVN
jgi:extracellular elastinolytic metalloproteinase